MIAHKEEEEVVLTVTKKDICHVIALSHDPVEDAVVEDVDVVETAVVSHMLFTFDTFLARYNKYYRRIDMYMREKCK